MRASLGWKHHEVPWREYYNSPPPPMDGRGTENKREGLHSESLSWLEAPWSEYYNSTHHPTASPSQHFAPVCCHFSTKLKTCACVCVVGGGEGGGNLKIYFSFQRKSSDGTVRTQIRTPWYSVWRDHHLSTNILEKCFKPEILQLEIEDNKKNRSSLDKHY